MDKNFIENLGWKYAGDWANRNIYKIGSFQMVEHNGSWFISKSDDAYFIEDPDEDTVKEYTYLVKCIVGCMEDAARHSLAEYNWSVGMLREFYKRFESPENFEL